MIGGQKADIVHLSLEPDVQKLVDEKLVAADWKSTPTKGILTQSVVVIVVRKGNPKNIKSWDDLIKPGVKIITPNPASSGSAKWNILAAYGHVLADGGTEGDAKAYLTKFFGNVEALPGQRPGRHHRVPERHRATSCCPTRTRPSWPGRAVRTSTTSSRPETLLIQNPGAVTTDAPSAAKKFLTYLTGKEAQTDYAEEGLPSAGRQHQGRRQGGQRPERPVPGAVQEAADHRRATSAAGPRPTPSSSTRTTAIVTKIQQETGKES